MIRNSFAILAAASLLALPASVMADGDCAACPACPAAKATTAAKGATCCPASAGTQSVMLKVKGNSEAVGKVLTSLEGVSAAETCSESKFTKVAFNKDKVCSDSIFAALKKAGYRVEAQQVTYAVDGLACEACVDKVSKALSKVKGVADAKVCHISKKAVVEFDPNKVSADKVLAAIDATGFKASEAAN